LIGGRCSNVDRQCGSGADCVALGGGLGTCEHRDTTVPGFVLFDFLGKAAVATLAREHPQVAGQNFPMRVTFFGRDATRSWETSAGYNVTFGDYDNCKSDSGGDTGARERRGVSARRCKYATPAGNVESDRRADRGDECLWWGWGGGGGGASASTPGAPATPTSTATPVRAGSARNEATGSNDAGTITLRVEDIVLAQGRTTNFSVLLADAAGRPVADAPIEFTAAPGLRVTLPDGNRTRADGSVNGSLLGLSGGTLTAQTAADSSYAGLSASLLVIVVGGPSDISPSVTPGGATPTPTALACPDVATIIVQTDTVNVSSQEGGSVEITAVVFNSNNIPVPNINVLFDVEPRVGTFSPLVNLTGNQGPPWATRRPS